MLSLYFGGAEVPGWRTLLANEGVEHVALSYMGLRRKTTFKRPWVVSEKFPDNQSIFLDSGAYTVNSADEDKYTQGELRDIAAHYMAFADANLDRLAMVSEFDALPLGLDWIKAMREDYWDDLPGDKFMPIWHPEWGLDELDDLCKKYDRVGVTNTVHESRNMTPTLNGMVGKYGTKLHGVAMTKIDEMSAVKWDSVASTSWLSPAMYGDTIIWTGKELKRYPKKYKDRARKQHRTLFTKEGFDSEKIEADDTTEVLRLSIWSWQRLVDDISRHKIGVRQSATDGVTTSGDGVPLDNAQEGGDPVGTSLVETRKAVVTRERSDDERRLLPGMALILQKEGHLDPETGQHTEPDSEHIKVRSQSMRICDSCFLASKCPAFEPGSNCAYDIPLTIQTPGQLRSLQNALIEMQGQRVLFMRMAEDMEGGYADPNLSNEIDRLQKLVAKKVELETDGFSLKIEAKGRGKSDPGFISRWFGAEAGTAAHQLPASIRADDAILVLDAEFADDERVVTP